MDINDHSEILMYQTDDGATQIEVKMQNETVWLTQAQLAELFQTSTQNITIHIKNIYEEGELNEDLTCKDSLQVRQEGQRTVQRKTKIYNLDVIISVGYRVKSLRGTQFRIWANQRIKEYIVKGFSMNDHLLKNAGEGNYFRELLERIRDIRSSEKVFYRQILEIYATSIDYEPQAGESKEFFKIVQNKMHFAAHGHTAAEIIYLRANSDKDFMGLTSYNGESLKKADVAVAKNYLQENEIKILNRLVTAYLEFAELQALRQRPMYMKDWVGKLDEFIKMSGSDVLYEAGKISHEEAKMKAELEYEKFKRRSRGRLAKVEIDFLDHVIATQKKLEKHQG